MTVLEQILGGLGRWVVCLATVLALILTLLLSWLSLRYTLELVAWAAGFDPDPEQAGGFAAVFLFVGVIIAVLMWLENRP